MKTYHMSHEEAVEQRGWYVIDAGNRPLGRVATEVAHLLRGKHKPTFSPHLDCGDHVIVINASRIALTGNKATDKMYYRHSGYPGGLRATPYGELRERKPDLMVRLAVKRMLPRTVLGREALRRLRVFAGPEHTHQAQKPKQHQV